MDALEPTGFGHVFPRGTLREPLDGLGRADVVVLYPRRRASHRPAGGASPPDRSLCSPRIVGRNGPRRPQPWWPPAAPEQPLESLAGQRVAALCGIGNPAGFRHTLATCGYQVVDVPGVSRPP